MELTEDSKGFYEPLHETMQFIDYAAIVSMHEEHSGTICFNFGFVHC
jgi:hypothetical protein